MRLLFCFSLRAAWCQIGFAQFATILNVPPDAAPPSIGFGTQLNLFDGGALDNRFVTSEGSELNVFGGTVGTLFSAGSGSVVNVAGGSIAIRSSAGSGSMVNISGGSVGGSFRAESGSVVNVSGGIVDSTFFVDGGGQVNISGGTVDQVEVRESANVNISGGSRTGGFHVSEGAAVNLIVSKFVLNGTDLTGALTPTHPVGVDIRDITISGILGDGLPFSFDLNSVRPPSSLEDYFDLGASLQIILTPPGDFTGNARVNGADFLTWQRGDSPTPLSEPDLADWQANFGVGIPQNPPGDFDGDGDRDGADFLVWQRGDSLNGLSPADLAAWQAHFGAGTAPLTSNAVAIPEPATLVFVGTILVALVGRRFAAVRR